MGNVSADGKWLWLSGRYDHVAYAFDSEVLTAAGARRMTAARMTDVTRKHAESLEAVNARCRRSASVLLRGTPFPQFASCNCGQCSDEKERKRRRLRDRGDAAEQSVSLFVEPGREIQRVKDPAVSASVRFAAATSQD